MKIKRLLITGLVTIALTINFALPVSAAMIQFGSCPVCKGQSGTMLTDWYDYARYHGGTQELGKAMDLRCNKDGSQWTMIKVNCNH